MNKKGKKSVKEKILGGLCASCRYAETCRYLEKSEQIIFQCDEYEGYEEKDSGKTKSIPEDSQIDKQQDQKDSRYIGLCASCENRDSCPYIPAEGGVWHCEEYR